MVQFAYEKCFLINSLVFNGREKIDFHHRSTESCDSAIPLQPRSIQSPFVCISFLIVPWNCYHIDFFVSRLPCSHSLYSYLCLVFSCFCECYWIRFWLCDATMHLLSNHFHIQSTDTLTSYKRDTSSNPLEQQTAVQINSASRVWIKPMKKHADDTHTHCSLRNIHK